MATEKNILESKKFVRKTLRDVRKSAREFNQILEGWKKRGINREYSLKVTPFTDRFEIELETFEYYETEKNTTISE